MRDAAARLGKSIVTLIFVALAAGLIAGISPCIVPVLPVVFVAGVGTATAREPGTGNVATVARHRAGPRREFQRPGTRRLRGPFAPPSAPGLPTLVRRWHPRSRRPRIPGSPARDLLERPFARITGRQPSSSSGGLVIGLVLGWSSPRAPDRSWRR